MTHTKIFIREDGTKARIFLRYSTEWYKDDQNWEMQISILLPRKRNWKQIADPLDYKFRMKDDEEKRTLIEAEQLNCVTPEEIHQAKLELWNKLKPEA
jgi:hypothetical protein